ncbi:hypothetical protein Maq22A_2p42415 (plasmid) [Methylobacterium aquaticum]|uniref:Uncharacterized protein n=1 Tax=Methylobacterium aquaticum TaxID=270351 RepID=A0A0C6FPJ6_9HYPH|nr:hypothetical protein Maq22A_2p42415 [Methylobacterium aquaticum]
MTLSRTCPGFGAAAHWSGYVPLHAIDEEPAATHPAFQASARSCPMAWCRLVKATTITGLGRDDQAARVGRLTRGSSPIGAMLSRVM